MDQISDPEQAADLVSCAVLPGARERQTILETVDLEGRLTSLFPGDLPVLLPDGKTILYATSMTSPKNRFNQLYRVPAKGGLPEKLPVPYGEFGAISPDGKTLAYVPISVDFRTWKRYRGGMADDVWLYDFKTKATTNLTSNPALDIIPMWKGNTVYFVSDRDASFRMNLYSYNLGTKQTKKLTDFTEYDIKFPSLGDNAIVFENGGWIYKLDLATEKAEKILHALYRSKTAIALVVLSNRLPADVLA